MPSHSNPEPGRAPFGEQFPILEKGLYFNHAAIGPWPRCTAKAVQYFAEENLRSGSANYRHWYARENELRKDLARLTGAASPDDIALLKNTTEGICLVAWGLDWRAGDNIVMPRDEFASNRLPWLAQASRGVEVREIDIRAADHAESALIDAMDERTRLLTVSAVQWNDGLRLGVHALGEVCHRKNVLFFVDAIQQLGALPMDAEACRIDFMAADAHKWLLAPEGIAVFYCSESARPKLRLSQQGWHMFENPWNFDRSDWTPAPSAKRFEAGSPNTLGQAALHSSLKLLLGHGMDKVAERVMANTGYLMQNLARFPGIHIRSRTETERRSGIVSFMHEQLPATGLHRDLTRAGVSCVVRNDSIRLSPHFYQGEPQLEAFLEILARVTG
jgi:selenocysteine lyase/cysteine desulfurase